MRTETSLVDVATLPDDCGNADTLVRAADRALYSAKRRGRNRVELFQSQEDTAAVDDATQFQDSIPATPA